MQRNPDEASEPENASALFTRRDALRRGLFLGLGTAAAVVTVSACAGGGGDEEDDDDD